MELIDKARILSDLWWNHRRSIDEELLEWADLGFPYAFGIAEGDILGLSAKGEQAIQELWDEFCDRYDLDADAEYGSLEDMIGFGGQ